MMSNLERRRLMRRGADDLAERARRLLTEAGDAADLDALVAEHGPLENVYPSSGHLVFRLDGVEADEDERIRWMTLWQSVIVKSVARQLGVSPHDVDLDGDTGLATVWVDNLNAFDYTEPTIHGKVFVKPVLTGRLDATYDVHEHRVTRTDWHPDHDVDAGIDPVIVGTKY